MKPSILILSTADDEHAQAVANHLRALGSQPQFWSAHELLSGWALAFELNDRDIAWRAKRYAQSVGAVGAVDAVGTTDNQKIDFDTIDCIWLRRPGKIDVGIYSEPWAKAFVERECNRALQSMFRTLSCRWINSPPAQHNARFKPAQLKLAKECGLSVPETLITNDPEAVVQFYRRCGGQVIYKLIDEGTNSLLPQHEVPIGLYTLPLRQSDLKYIEQVRSCLHLFQRRVEKKYDIRVTAVGRKLFAAAIDSQSGRGAVDFRLDYSVPIKAHELPPAISERLLKLMAKMDLTYGAIDLVLDCQGQYHFLEVNPAGQWLWIENALGLPIALAVAEALLELN